MRRNRFLPLLLSLALTGCAGHAAPVHDPAAAPDEPDLPVRTREELLLPEEPDNTPEEMPEPEEAPLLAEEEPEAPGSGSDELSALAEEILAAASSDYEQVKAIHDYLVLHVDYDYENLAAGTLPDTAFTKEGALLLHSAVCEGYARAFSYLCGQAGIEELLVYGTADDGTGVQTHAWNQVRVDGEWYNVDVTWDDPILNGQVVTDGSNRIYDYFLVPDSVLQDDHTAESPKDRHPCTSDRYLESNRRLTIEPYLREPCSFTASGAEVQEAVEQYLSEGVHAFQLICDTRLDTPENWSGSVLDQVKDTMTVRGLYGQIQVETQYGVADYAVIDVTITP